MLLFLLIANAIEQAIIYGESVISNLRC